MNEAELLKERSRVIDEIIDCWAGHKKGSESDLYQDFLCWCEDIAEYRISLREEDE